MILLTTDEIIELHKKLIERTGGSHGLRDRNLLESAIYSAQAELINLGLSVANSRLDYEAVLQWITEHKI